jgi:OmcA/MtrC family decaheme c-type cytochrome
MTQAATKWSWAIVLVGTLALVGTLSLVGCKGDKGDKGDPGASAPTELGAGLKFTITGATAPAGAPPTVTFKVTDAADTPVDFLAELAAGKFGSTRGPRFSIAQANANGVYEALYENSAPGDPAGKQTRPLQVPANIALDQVAPLYAANPDGSYTFTFPTAAPALPTLAEGYPLPPVQNAQTLVGVQAARTFGGVTYPVGASLEFIPSGSGTVTPRQVVSDAACNNCHKHMQAHGTRRTVNLCLTCHTPGWIKAADANSTANPIDFRVLVHQIHRGKQPTDVQNEKPWVYKWSASTDFSTLKFAPPNTVRNCVACHQGGAQANNWREKPSRAACGSCHYTVNFATGAGHAGGAQANDDTCAICHAAETDSTAPSITKVHSFLYDALTNTTFAGRDLGVVVDAVDLSDPKAGTVTFTVTLDGQPHDVIATPLDSLRFTIAGPTTDYGGPAGPVAPAGVLNVSVGYVQTGAFTGAAAALLTPTGTPGQFRAPLATVSGTPPVATNLDFSAAKDAGSTFGIGVEAYIVETGTSTCTNIPQGTTCPATRQWAQRPLPPTASSPSGVVYSKVGFKSDTTGSNAPVPRRLITEAARCNKCHEDLGFHGGESRKGPDYCAMCHNTRNVNDERTSQLEAPFSKTPNSVQLGVMIHKIHKGPELVPSGSLPNPRPTYALGATRDFRAGPDRAEGEAPPEEFTHQFPGDIMDCQTCHLPGGYGLPEANVLPTRSVKFDCKEAAGADGNAVCGTLSSSGGVVAPDTPAGDEFWNKTESVIGSGQAHCGTCHDSTNAQTHFSAMTVEGVESCDVCHGDQRILDPIEIHLGRP